MSHSKIHLSDIAQRPRWMTSWERLKHKEAHWFVEMAAEMVCPGFWLPFPLLTDMPRVVWGVSLRLLRCVRMISARFPHSRSPFGMQVWEPPLRLL